MVMQLTEFTKQVELLASKNEPNQVVSKVCNTFGNVVNPCPFVLYPYAVTSQQLWLDCSNCFKNSKTGSSQFFV